MELWWGRERGGRKKKKLRNKKKEKKKKSLEKKLVSIGAYLQQTLLEKTTTPQTELSTSFTIPLPSFFQRPLSSPPLLFESILSSSIKTSHVSFLIVVGYLVAEQLLYHHGHQCSWQKIIIKTIGCEFYR